MITSLVCKISQTKLELNHLRLFAKQAKIDFDHSQSEIDIISEIVDDDATKHLFVSFFIVSMERSEIYKCFNSGTIISVVSNVGIIITDSEYNFAEIIKRELKWDGTRQYSSAIVDVMNQIRRNLNPSYFLGYQVYDVAGTQYLK